MFAFLHAPSLTDLIHWTSWYQARSTDIVHILLTHCLDPLHLIAQSKDIYQNETAVPDAPAFKGLWDFCQLYAAGTVQVSTWHGSVQV